MEPPKQEMAEERTDWAEDRTVLASERTFASWMRTCLASVAIALYIQSVMGEIDPHWVGRAIGTLFLVAALFMIWGARQQACQTRDRITGQDVVALPKTRINVIAVLMIAGTLCVGAILWIL